MIAFTPRSSGFTLVELAITLVIIGLIIGGILVGRDLVNAAQFRKQVKQIEELETQINAFRLKYNCLPGDCTNATSLFGTTDSDGDTVENGNGDGVIKSILDGADHVTPLVDTTACTSQDVWNETLQLFVHIQAARVGSYKAVGNYKLSANSPGAAIDNGAGIYVTCLYGSGTTPLFLRSGNLIVIGGTTAAGQNGTGNRVAYSTGLASGGYGGYGNGWNGTQKPMGIPMDAIRYADEKIDDGVSTAGRFGVVIGDAGCTYTSNTLCLATAAKKISQ